MNSQYTNRPIPVGNPLANALVVIVGALAIGVSLFLGMVVFVVLGSIVLVMAAIIAIRLWWFQWRMRKSIHGKRARQAAGTPDGAIEGEFRVVSRDSDDPDA